MRTMNTHVEPRKPQGFSRVLTRPAVGIRRCFKNPRVESRRVRKGWNYHGSSRAGSGGFQISRVGPVHPDTIRPARSDLTREKRWEKNEERNHGMAENTAHITAGTGMRLKVLLSRRIHSICWPLLVGK